MKKMYHVYIPDSGLPGYAVCAESEAEAENALLQLVAKGVFAEQVKMQSYRVWINGKRLEHQYTAGLPEIAAKEAVLENASEYELGYEGLDVVCENMKTKKRFRYTLFEAVIAEPVAE